MQNQGLWLIKLRIDPLPALLAWPDEALRYHVRRGLLSEPVGECEELWNLPQVTRLVNKQQADGSWKYPGKTESAVPGQNYCLLETYRVLRELVEKYSLNCDHVAIQRAADYVFSCQTDEGDIRGILSNQYMPYYHGAILELLIKAGYKDDLRTLAGLEWLLEERQDDGGWLIPMQAVPSSGRTAQFWSDEPFQASRSLPSSHLATGMALRALAAHPAYCQRPESIQAANLLKSCFFKPDHYTDRQAPSYWLKFQFPFWWPNLLTGLDLLSRVGLQATDYDIRLGLEWFFIHQESDGLWPTGYDSGQNAPANRRWVGLAVCRMLKNFYGHAAT